jgi:amino acid carrier protein
LGENQVEAFYALVDNLSGFIWGGTWNGTSILPPYASPMVVLLLGTGLFFTVVLGFRPLKRLFPAFGELWAGRKAKTGAEGEITPWQALSTALSGQVGTGNLAGVATAITLGGPGAIFWMWITALFGMAAAFAESSLAVKYRETHADGHVHGGPMYYIKNGLGKGWGWLAVLFCIGTLFSAAASGGMIQANSITQSVVESGRTINLSIPSWSIGLVLAGLVFAVIIGGIKSIGSVAGKVVPFMALAYVLAALVVLILHASEIPEAFRLIFAHAFGLEQAAGGMAGYAVMSAIRYGVARGLFSNEAGQGSAPIAHAAAKTQEPAKQGEIAMIGVFIDTIIICTMTALVLLTVTGDFKRNPAREMAEACMSVQALTLPAGVAENEIFPSAYADDRVDVIARQGATARKLLEGCQAAKGEDAANAMAWIAPVEQKWELALSASDADITREVKYAWQTDAEASAATARAYDAGIPGGQWIITIALFFFAFTTIIGWAYYGEQAVTYLFGDGAAKPFRFIWVGVIFAGALQEVDFIWRLGDLANASMALPNLIAILALSGVVVAIAKDYDLRRKNPPPEE